MNITKTSKGILQVDDARIIFRNFQGRESEFNHAGERNFSLLIQDPDDANSLIDSGYHVKIKEPRTADESPLMTLKVKVRYKNDRGPIIYLVAGDNKIKLDEENVGILDQIDIEQIDLDIRPYDWEIGNKSGRTAYLQSMYVVQKLDRFAERYGGFKMDEEDEDVPF